MTATAERFALETTRAVVDALGDGVAAAYAVGSTSYGGFEPGTSDLDVVAVLAAKPTRARLQELVHRVHGLDFAPARGLELVVYHEGDGVLNLNTGPGMDELVAFEGEPAFWFTLDRAVAEQHARTLSGPPWSELFEPVERREILAALAESIAWHEEHEPTSRNTVLNASRALTWLETGTWASKRDAAAWMLMRVKEQL
jgi:hypothetical protein